MERQDNVRGKMKVVLVIKKSRRCSLEVVGFLREKLGQDHEFKSEDL